MESVERCMCKPPHMPLWERTQKEAPSINGTSKMLCQYPQLVMIMMMLGPHIHQYDAQSNPSGHCWYASGIAGTATLSTPGCLARSAPKEDPA
ncbi:hypothetical protein QCA50_009663 [Cerrena zonata]|uniref:Uncharacterized protein n=1 Tax=Cerrena zonata TaxID=2478898 RepID=A0AAW0GDM0_9APHY